MGAVKDPFSSLFPTAAFGTMQVFSVLLLSQKLSQNLWDEDSDFILCTVLIHPHYKRQCSVNYKGG